MNINVDVIIFIGFLATTVIVGLLSSRGIRDIKEYAVGNRNFSTATIVSTLVATWISGEFFYSSISEAYNLGLHAIWIAAGDPICLLLIGIFFAPRMGEFLGKLSIAEAMGDLFGQRVRVITAISGFIGSAGIIAIQLKMAGFVFEWALGLPSIYGLVSAAVIVTLYSTFGGIKSVTFTDVIQFFTFGIAIPIIAYVLLTSIDNLDIVSHTLTTNPLYDYKEVFDFSKPLPFRQLFIFLLFVIVGFNPAIFQRVAIAKNTKQVGRSFIIAAVVCLLFGAIINWMAILTYSINPSLSANDVIKHIIFNSPYVGLRGAILAGVMAMIMSTVDSFINSTAVLVVHDFCKPLKISLIKDELLFARVVSVLIGVFSLVLSLRESDSFQEWLVITYSLYMPIVIPAFTMAVFGFRSSEKSVLFGMIAGLISVLIWDYVLEIKAANSTFFGIVANLVVLMGTHYLLRQPGGWVGIKDNASLIHSRNERKKLLRSWAFKLQNFKIVEVCRKNCPKNEGLISILGLFIMISSFASTHTLGQIYQIQYSYLINTLYPLTLFASTALITYPLWLQNWKGTAFISIIWNVSMFLVLICFSLLMVLISEFSEIQLMVFMVNLIIVSSLITWSWALFTIVLGACFTTFFFHKYVPVGLHEHLLSLQFKIVYLMLLVISTLVIFLRPKQQYQELTEEKNDHLNGRLTAQEKELKQALALRGEFIRNLTHEYHAPMTGIISMSQVLLESYDKLTDEQRISAAEAIYKSSIRLEHFDSNIASLAKLSKPGYELRLETINFSDLTEERLKICRKLYDGNTEEREFECDVEDRVLLSGDKYYLTQVLDNLIINAIAYCKNGKITITLKQSKESVSFTITDEGVGIPPRELEDIFMEFMVSSKTHTQAGGRGVGLALCKRVIEVHGGIISAESDGIKGSKFTLTLPK